MKREEEGLPLRRRRTFELLLILILDDGLSVGYRVGGREHH